MSQGTIRLIFRWIHIVFGIPILGYIYSPFDQVHYYAGVTRFVFVPALLLSGLWLWKGHIVRRLISRRPVLQQAAESQYSNPEDCWHLSSTLRE
jgi:hypothetical protein